MLLERSIELPAEFRLGCSLRYSPDGKFIAVISSTWLVLVAARDLSIQSQRAIPNGCSIDFSPDGSFLVVGSWSVGEVLSIEEATTFLTVGPSSGKAEQN